MNTLVNILAGDANENVKGTGWLRPVPDLRDYTRDQPEIKQFAEKLGMETPGKKILSSVDLRKWCSPVEDQGSLGSCTANAAAGIVEYYEMKSFGRRIECSRLFIYKTTRNLMQETGDSGASIRSTLGALALCGTVPEKYWPYNIEELDTDPGPFIYSLADNYEALKYFCHDAIGARVTYPDVLLSVKKYLESGIPSVFGFWGFPSFDKSDTKGGIPYPGEEESAQWGHAVVAVGYDDARVIKNTENNRQTTGALLIRNSWGKEWGDKGYGWLPYEYVLTNLALDFWSLLGMEWVDSGQFGI